MKPLTYRSPMNDKYLWVGKIDCGGEDLATMIDTDDFLITDYCTFKHGADGGGLQMEIDEIGEKMVRAFNCHDDLLAACEMLDLVERNGITHLIDIMPAVEAARAALAKANGE